MATPLTDFLAATRKFGDEAQWTRIVAAAAGSDPLFARDLVHVLLANAPRKDLVEALDEVPASLECKEEVALGKELGRVDVRFEDESGDFVLYVEHKLASAYGFEQLRRYLTALDRLGAARSALIAVTATTPLTGEAEVAEDPRWLGSVRWSDVFAGLRSLDHVDPGVSAAWKATLDLLSEQGDFGPMDLKAKEHLFDAWAQREEAEKLVRYFLTEVAGVPELVGGAARIGRGKAKTSVVNPHRGAWHLRYAVPANAGEERLRVQFLSAKSKPFFTVEARYQNLHAKPGGDPGVAEATQALGPDFDHGKDGTGWYWARVLAKEEWLKGPDTLEQLRAAVKENVERLHRSAIFKALDEFHRSAGAG